MIARRTWIWFASFAAILITLLVHANVTKPACMIQTANAAPRWQAVSLQEPVAAGFDPCFIDVETPLWLRVLGMCGFVSFVVFLGCLTQDFVFFFKARRQRRLEE